MFLRYQEHIADLKEMAGVYEHINSKIETVIDDLTVPEFD
jgi:hypothetical protein